MTRTSFGRSGTLSAQSRRPMQLVRNIGRYSVERLLGHGSFATVWLAYDPDLDSRVAIKVLAENWSLDQDIRERFLHEARLLRRLDHERIVRVHDVDHLPDGRPYFVMEYADRGSLEDRMTQRRRVGEAFSVLEAVDLSREIARALGVAHALGVVHRDLKPSNVLFRTVPVHHQAGSATSVLERLLLADFGIARALEGGTSMTLSAGTPRYMAPEQAWGRAEARSDVYSAGVILWELLAGELPYDRKPAEGLEGREPLPPISDRRPDVPAGLAELLRAALERDASQRPTAEGWQAGLGAALELGPDHLYQFKRADVPTEFQPAHTVKVGRIPARARMALVVAAAAVIALGPFVFARGFGSLSPAPTIPDEPVTAIGGAGSTFADEEEPSPDAQSPGDLDGVAWRVEFGGEIGEVAVDEGSVLVALADGTVHAVDAATGEPQWGEPFDAGGPAGDLVAFDGRLYFTRERSQLVSAVDLSGGRETWRTLVPFQAVDASPRLALAGDSVFVGFGSGVTSLRASSGDELWAIPSLARLLVDSISAEGSLLAVGDGRWVYGLDGTSGDRKWEIGPPVVSDGAAWMAVQQVEGQSGFGRTSDLRVVVLTGTQNLVMLDGDTGGVRWTAPVSGLPTAAPEAIYAAGVDGELVAVDTADGSILWANSELRPTQTPIMAEGSVYVLAGDDLIAVNPRSGTEIGRASLGVTASLAPEIVGQVVVVVSENILLGVQRLG